MKSKLTSIVIPVDTHKKLVAYCQKQGLKIYVWVDKLILQALEKENEKEIE